MPYRYLILSSVVLGSAAIATADPEIAITIDGGVSTHLIDRGETLALLNNEAAITAEIDLASGAAYAAIYRITPIGDDDSAFDEEVDYTIGYAFSGNGWAADVSANYLTYPGNNDDASTELAASLEFDMPLTPSLTGFYDVDFEDYGLEAAIVHEIEVADWTYYGLARAGLVSPGGGGDYSYGGLEAGLSYPLSEELSLGGFVRIEASDEDTFVDDINAGAPSSFRDHGESIGVTLSWTP